MKTLPLYLAGEPKVRGRTGVRTGPSLKGNTSLFPPAPMRIADAGWRCTGCIHCGHIFVRTEDGKTRNLNADEKLRLQQSPNRDAIKAMSDEVIACMWG